MDDRPGTTGAAHFAPLCLGARPLSTAGRRISRLCALVVLISPIEALAQSSFIPYAGEQYEHDSNIFYLPSTVAPPVGSSGPTLADNALRSLGGLESSYQWNRQKFYVTGEARRFDYHHFSYLNHSEVLLKGGMNWALGSALDGLVDYRHERRMVPFSELIASTQLSLETENIATAAANLRLSPDWRLESRGIARTLDSPRPLALDLSLREDSIHEGLRYLGVANLSAGFEVEYLSGRFTHDPTATNPHYHQTTEGIAANYTVSKLTSFNGNLGYTRRSDFGGNDVSGVTGSLGYVRSLTGKTTVTANVSRAVNSYVTTSGSEIDTSAGLGLAWRATYRITASGGYTWTENKFPQLLLVNRTTLSNRSDRLQLANLELDYQILRWLTIRSYARYQTRRSNLANFTFDASIYGIEIQARLQPRK